MSGILTQCRISTYLPWLAYCHWVVATRNQNDWEAFSDIFIDQQPQSHLSRLQSAACRTGLTHSWGCPKVRVASTVSDQSVSSLGMLGYLLAIGEGQQWHGAVASGVIYRHGYCRWVIGWSIPDLRRRLPIRQRHRTHAPSSLRHSDVVWPRSKLGPWHSWICPITTTTCVTGWWPLEVHH